MRWCWVNFQCRSVLLILVRVGQGPTALAVGAGGAVWIFVSLFSLPLWKMTRYRLKYCLKGPLSPKPTSLPISPLSGGRSVWTEILSQRTVKSKTTYKISLYFKICLLCFFLKCFNYFCLHQHSTCIFSLCLR